MFQTRHLHQISMTMGDFSWTRGVIFAITENKELLEDTPWLKESIHQRNRLLRRSRSGSDKSNEQVEELRHLTRLTIKDLAAEMQTSG